MEKDSSSHSLTKSPKKVQDEAMLNQCVVCNSLWKDEVNDLLEKKMPYSFIVNFLKGKGIDLSAQSISRHNTNHRLSNKKDKQVQKKGILKAKEKAKTYVPPTFNDSIGLKAKDKPPVCPEPNHEDVTTQRSKAMSYQKEFEKMSQDIDVIKEFMEVLAIAKDRVKRGLNEEQDSGLVLATTGNAIKDYGVALKNFHEITSGMESITKLRYAQLVQLVGNVFSQAVISDQTKHELLTLVQQSITSNTPVRLDNAATESDHDSNHELDVDELIATIGKEEKYEEDNVAGPDE